MCGRGVLWLAFGDQQDIVVTHLSFLNHQKLSGNCLSCGVVVWPRVSLIIFLGHVGMGDDPEDRVRTWM